LKYGRLNFLEPSGPVQACNGIAIHIEEEAVSVLEARDCGKG